jgi:hypothetical protein
MTDIQDKVFRDFIPPATTDGSYGGKKKHIEATQNHLKMKLQQELTAINQRLKASKTKVKILITGNAIQLQATLPLKPGDTHKQGRHRKQYKISLGIPANFDGLKTAEEEAYELGKLIARQTFIWTDKYLGLQATKDKGITFREFYDQFEKRYFETRKRTIKSENTFQTYTDRYRINFLCDLAINEQNIKSILNKKTDPHARRSCQQIASLINKMLDLNLDLTGFNLKYIPKKRDIPDDKQIVEYINIFETRYKTVKTINHKTKDNWKLYKLIYGLLATYGLRPREIVNQPDLNWLLSPENELTTFKVHGDNKTGYREVIPFVSEWVDLFDLKNEENVEALKVYSGSWKTSNELRYRIIVIAKSFQRNGIPFQPYDLRHACAIRAHLQGVPIKAAADNLGHTVEMHTKTYQRWFGMQNRIKAFNRASEEQTENEKLKDELTFYKKRLGELELENARLKLQLGEYHNS